MKSLLVMRHAKSDYPADIPDDFDRPLSKRGLKDAPRMARVLFGAETTPDLISSPAIRAKETVAGLEEGGLRTRNTRFDDRLYLADTQTLYEVISELRKECSSALIIGHNPGLESWIEELCGCRLRMPTAGVVAIDLNCTTWDQSYNAQGQLQWFHIPKIMRSAE